MTENVKPLIDPLLSSRLCLTPPQLCLSSNTKDYEELIGSKGTDT